MTIQNRIVISDQEWIAAELFFNDPANQDVVKKPRARDGQEGFGTLNHSFLKIDGVIYAMDNQDTQNPEGKYIGLGGFAAVSIVQTRSGDNFALKIEGDVDPEDRDNELAILKLLGRFFGTATIPGAKKILISDGEKDATQKHYTIQALMAGKDLDEQILEVPLSNDQKLLIAIKAALQVHMLHQHHVVHVDIKPNNFRCAINDFDIAVNIVDFGFSQILQPGQTRITLSDFRGTDDWVAPEVQQDFEYSFAGDVYSLAEVINCLGLSFDPDRAEEIKLEELLSQAIDNHPMRRPALIVLLYQMVTVLETYSTYQPNADEQAEYDAIKAQAVAYLHEQDQRKRLGPTNLLYIKEKEWAAAELYFNDPRNGNSTKLRRPRGDEAEFATLKHSFIKINDVIYAMDMRGDEDDKFLGKGNFGIVSIAQARNGDNFALKVEGEVSPRFRNNELTVMGLLGQLKGTLVRIGKKTMHFDDFQKQVHEKNYTLKKLHLGLSLDTLIKENELSKTQQLLIASGFLQQVYLLQQNNIVHGDIQPGNCITEVDEQSVQAGLIGFRYSHILPEGQTTLTVTDYDVKTPYTAPEVSTEGKYSFASDIYALGVLLTEDLDLQLDPTSNREQQLILMIKAMVKSDPAQRPALITVLNQLITVLPRQADYVPDPHEETNYAKIKLEAALVAKKPMSANVNAENAEPATEIAALVGNTYIPLASRATLSALAHTRCESNGGLDPRNGNDHTNQRPTINN